MLCKIKYENVLRTHPQKYGLFFKYGSRHKRHFASAADKYDYVIIGAGTAGCILANKLSAEPKNKVLLLEAGGKANSWMITMPAALRWSLFNPKYNFCYYSTPQKHLNNRLLFIPRGKMWGGCSSHHAMVFIRGHPYDFNRWAENEGAEGWSFSDCLPYFKDLETNLRGGDLYRGDSGPLKVTRGTMVNENPMHNAFIEAGMQAGYPFTDDINGFQQEGFGYLDMNIWKGKRCNSNTAYLQPALSRPNLDTLNYVSVSKVTFDGKKAKGVEYRINGEMKEVLVDREVIMSAGAVHTPQLLKLSGIGNADELNHHGIPLLQHLPGVGENLQDHLEAFIQYKCSKPFTLYKYQWKFPHNMIKVGLQWFLLKSGPCATTHMEAGGFIRSAPGIEHPDIQYHFLPSLFLKTGNQMGEFHGFQAHSGTLRSPSKGTVKLNSNNPEDAPLLDFNQFSTEQDRIEMIRQIKLTREIFEQKAFDPYRDYEMAPGKNVQTDDDIEKYIRENATSGHHLSGTAKMGSSNDEMAVTDPQCKVYGIEGLRVVDASLMPSITSGNLVAPVMMMANRAADLIMGKPLLPKEYVPIYKPESLDTQR